MRSDIVKARICIAFAVGLVSAFIAANFVLAF